MTLTVDIPTLETERLTLRPPRIEDTEVFGRFIVTDRAAYVGGSPDLTRRTFTRAFGHVAGLWVMRGYSLFIMEHRGQAIGMVGPFYPIDWPEPEFSWTVWSEDHEGQGLVTEAMRVVAPWFWQRTGLDTAISVIDRTNLASRRVAERMGATVDVPATEAANRPGSPFFADDGSEVDIWRHTASATDAAPTQYRRDTDVPTGGLTNV